MLSGLFVSLVSKCAGRHHALLCILWPSVLAYSMLSHCYREVPGQLAIRDGVQHGSALDLMLAFQSKMS